MSRSPSRSNLRLAVGFLALLGVVGRARAAPVQFNAQLAGDLSEDQKRRIEQYLKKQHNAPAAPVVVGERPLKTYTTPTSQELTPGTPEFQARVAKVKPELGDRLIGAKRAAEMLKAGTVLVDIRTHDEVMQQTAGELPQQAVLVPFNDWAGRFPPPVMRGRTVILTCFHGNKSVLAWEALRAQFADAYVLEDGVMGWKAAGLPTRVV